MSDAFKDREKGYEAKYQLDEEQRFKAESRRNKLLGLWAAELLGKTGDDAKAYAQEVIKADFIEAGDNDVFQKIRKDFDDAGVDQSDHQIRRHMAQFLGEAETQVHTE